jgi:hypothetical protein
MDEQDTMEYYPDFRRREILTHAMTWTHLEDIPVKERKSLYGSTHMRSLEKSKS